MILRFPETTCWMLSILICASAASLAPAQGSHPLSTSSCSDQTQITAIQAEIARIDTAFDAAEAPATHHLSKETGDWQFSGLMENEKPVFLSAEYSEGHLVRRESYYLQDGRVIFVSVDQSWDVDDARKAPEPEKRRDFYIDKDRTVCRVMKTSSKPPVTHTENTAEPSEKFSERSRLIASILAGEVKGHRAVEPLEDFPEAFPPQP